MRKQSGKTKLRICFLVIAALVCTGAAFQIFRDRVRNPIYQGKRLSEWLRGYETDFDSIQWKATDQAIQHLGTNAVPFLLKERRVSDSEIKTKISYWMSRHLKFRYVPAERRRELARKGILALRPRADEVVPELMKIYQSGKQDDSALIALNAIGELGRVASSAAPLLLHETRSTNVYVRSEAFWVLTQIHAEPELVVPVFIKGLNDTDITVRGVAARGLEGCGRHAESAIPALRESLEQVKSRESEFQDDNDAQARYRTALGALSTSLQWIKEASAPELVIPGLIDALHNSDYYGRMTAAEKLGKFGSDAKEAVPKLIEMRDEEKQMLQRVPNSIDRKRMYTAITDALYRINGTNAAP
jgi:hypothetical protein